MANVTFTVTTRDGEGAMVDSVVSLLDASTLTLVASAATANGVAALVGDDTTSYLIALSVVGFTADTYQVQPTQDANYEIRLVPRHAPRPRSPHECCLYGTLVNARGDAARSLRLSVSVASGPIVRPDGALIINDDVQRAGVDGYVELFLLRGREYAITLVGTDEVLTPETLRVYVPDVSSAPLSDVLFPYATVCALDPNSRAVTLTLSDGRTLTRAADIRPLVTIRSAHTIDAVGDTAVLNGEGNVELYTRLIGFTSDAAWSVQRRALVGRRLL